MKRIAMCLLILFLSTGLAYALPATLIDVTEFTATGTNPLGDLNRFGGNYVNELEGITDHVKWAHHFEFDPYIEIYSAVLTLALRDDEADVWWKPMTCELAFGWAEDRTWDFGEVDTGDYSYDVNVAFLEDGEFSVSLYSLGDFFIDSSTLTIDYETQDSPAPVPEPATILLFGTGMMGLAGFERHRRKKQV